MYRWSAGSIGGGAAGGAARVRGPGCGGHTYYVINPRPPRRRALRTRAGFPRPRASRPLTTHGAPRSAAASRSATRADVAPRFVFVVRSTHDIIHANLRPLIFLPSDRSETGAPYRECRMFVDVTPVYFSIGIRAYETSSEWRTAAPSLGWDLRPANVAVTRGLRCCARDRLATVPRNVRIC